MLCIHPGDSSGKGNFSHALKNSVKQLPLQEVRDVLNRGNVQFTYVCIVHRLISVDWRITGLSYKDLFCFAQSWKKTRVWILIIMASYSLSYKSGRTSAEIGLLGTSKTEL